MFLGLIGTISFIENSIELSQMVTKIKLNIFKGKNIGRTYHNNILWGLHNLNRQFNSAYNSNRNAYISKNLILNVSYI
jgi:hypothetical protein